MAALTLAVAVAILGTACGSGGSGTGGATESAGASSSEPAQIAEATPGKKQYVKKGDAICEEVPTRYNALLAKLPEKQQENPKVTVPKAAVPPLWEAVDEFAALGAPSGDEEKAEAIVVALENAAKGLEKEPEGGLSGPESSFAEFNKLTKKYGFETCAQL